MSKASSSALIRVHNFGEGALSNPGTKAYTTLPSARRKVSWMQSTWMVPIKSLCDILLHNEESIQLLRDIDAGMRDVLTARISLDDLLAEKLPRLHKLVQASG